MGSTCDTARRVSAAYDAKIMEGGTFPSDQPLLVDDGWSCRVTVSFGDGGEVSGVVCDRGTESVTFEWGV
jgi:hypothetical protein